MLRKKRERFFLLSIVCGLTLVSCLFFLVSDKKEAIAEEGMTTKVVIHYRPSEDRKGEDSSIWAWPLNGGGNEYDFEGGDAFGKYAVINLAGQHDQVGFLVKSAESWNYQTADQFIDTASGLAHVWLDEEEHLSYAPPAEEVAPQTKKMTVNLHYYRSGNDYEGWNVWHWIDGKDGQQAEFAAEDSYGKTATFDLEDAEGFSKLNFIIRKGTPDNEWQEKDGDSDRSVYVIEGQDTMDIWVMENDALIYNHPEFIVKDQRIKKASIETMQEINISLAKKERLADITPEDIVLTNEHGTLAITEVTAAEDELANQFTVKTVEPLDLQTAYDIQVKELAPVLVGIGAVVRTPEFDEEYFYDGTLGQNYTPEKTDFTLWAPTAKTVELVLYDGQEENSPEKETVLMDKGEKGTFTTVLNGDQHGTVYTYRLTFPDGTVNESTDPYATSAIVNGNRSVVLNPDSTRIQSFERMPAFSSPVDAIIYETHIRDLSIAADSGIQHKGKFLGVIEAGTKNEQGQPTGLDYIKSLGVTHVQFLPMYDYQTVDESAPDVPQYNWGYDPKNYNVPEGSYSTDGATRFLISA